MTTNKVPNELRVQMSGSDKDLFWTHVNKTPGCWLWTFTRKEGYGVWSRSRIQFRAHRMSYLLLRGPIPDGLVLDHLCRTPLCVNPNHLEPVTAIENVMRGTGLAPVNKRKTHCVHGHEYTPENTATKKNGRRNCRECHRIRNRANPDPHLWPPTTTPALLAALRATTAADEAERLAGLLAETTEPSEGDAA